MTNEQLRQTAAAMNAFADGKLIQYKRLDGGEWMDIIDPMWRPDQCEYRPRPEPVSRPWSKPEDVPGPVCWLRMNSDGYVASEQLITFISRDGVVFGGARMIWSQLEKYSYSVDRLIWGSCTVTK